MDDFYRRYKKGVEGFVAKRIDDTGVAEELTQDILTAAWRSKDDFRKESEEFSWICAIAKHKIIDYYRKKKLKTVLFSISPMFEEIADKALEPEEETLRRELKKEIKKTLRAVGEGYQKILRLKYVEGWRISEIAEKMKLTIKAVESRLIRAKKRFRENWNYDRKETKKINNSGRTGSD